MLGVGEVKKDEPHWTEVLTDVLLGFLAQPSQLWRILSKQTYRHFTSHLTEDALHLVIKVFKVLVFVKRYAIERLQSMYSYLICLNNRAISGTQNFHPSNEVALLMRLENIVKLCGELTKVSHNKKVEVAAK